MVGRENRRAATIKVVSTGSAAARRSQPGMGQSADPNKKTLGPGALDRGFLFAFVTLSARLCGGLGNRGETRLRPR